jgi:Transposase.
MKKRRKRREFTAALKQRAVERIKQGESVSALAREYQVERSRLYDWRDQWDCGRAFQGGGRFPKGSMQGKLESNEWDAARARIAELERKVGQQTLALDFLRGALRRVGRSQSTSNGSGATASSSTSEE